ncbi:hypothetical protein [Jannaschia aquimarina]|uniref:Uncharacterized protein n=1 Tax=Jannaschia aquimarina TaxID=935700 RepID=A0A0D1CNS9_9RHOB|nr:hypothetical protein [Jannaschia aquimarina]KIT16377.1 hypothetical protein jaqu_18610 [Jannaschia aquimarina]SNT05138.1 hypothetical protein SAMN05421775_10533 [Jannaschia aquimarina]
MDKNIPEYFYTVDLGPNFGPRLNKLAAMASFEDDVEAFAAILLSGAIEQLEASEVRFRKELDEYDENRPHSLGDPRGEMDDDIPF